MGLGRLDRHCAASILPDFACDIDLTDSAFREDVADRSVGAFEDCCRTGRCGASVRNYCSG
jgi:hypothetical protein